MSMNGDDLNGSSNISDNLDQVLFNINNFETVLTKDKHDAADGNLPIEINYLIKKLDIECYLKKLRHTRAIIDELLKCNDDEICIAFNGGKDCCVVLYLLYSFAQNSNYFNGKNRKINVLIMKLSEQFRELDDFIQQLFDKQEFKGNFNLIVYNRPNIKMKTCLEEFKANYPTVVYILMGTRRSDSVYYSNLKELAETDKGWPYFVRVSPILDWNYSELWYFIKRFNVPYCSLYDLGYTSLGDPHNTIKNMALLHSDGLTYNPAYMLEDDYKERNSRI